MICGLLKITIMENIVRGTSVKLLTNLMLHHEVTHITYNMWGLNMEEKVHKLRSISKD
jgi:hypothetical protein